MNRTETATTKVYVDSKDAEQAMADLRQEAAGLRKELKLAKESGDKEAFLSLSKSLDENKKKTNELKNAVHAYDNVVKNLSKSTLKDLERAQKTIAKELKSMTRGTEEYTQKASLLSKVRAEISATKAEMNQLGVAQKSAFNFTGAVNGINKYFGVLAGGFAAIGGAAITFRQSIDDYNEFEQKTAELSSLTELRGEELDYLKDKAKEFSVSMTDSGVRITSSASDILEAFKMMGGAKAELLENKEALAAVTREALILAEASGMTAQESVEALANTMNQFGASADQAAKYINVLAAGATAGSAEVDDISASMVKVGTAANLSNISVEETVALLETLAEKGVKAEVAGTQLRSVILKLNTGADEFNPKIVGMRQALENLSNANLTAEERVKMFGLESVTAANILIENREKYEELTVAVTGTSSAYEQAAINTDTNTAALKQAQNQVEINSIALGEKLSPALTATTNLYAKMLGKLVEFVDWASRNKDSLILLGKAFGILLTAIGSYWATLKAVSFYEKVTLVLTKGKTAATQALALAKALLRGNIDQATAAQQRFNVAASSNVYAAVISIVLAAASAFMMFSEDVDTATQSQADLDRQLEETNKRIQEQKNLLEQSRNLVNQIRGNNKVDFSRMSLSELQTALDDIETRIAYISVKDFDFNIKNEMLGINIQDAGGENAAKQRYEEETKNLVKTAALIKQEIALRNEKNDTLAKSDELSKKEKKALEDRKRLLEEWEKKVHGAFTRTEQALISKNERELNEIRNRYNDEILFAEQQAIKDVANKESWLRISDALVIQRNSELNEKRKEQEEAFQNELFKIRQKYEILTLDELMNDELKSLKQVYDEKLLTTEEYEALIAKIREKYRLKALEEENEFNRLKQEARDKWLGVTPEQQFARDLDALKADYDKKLLTTEEYELAIFNLKKKYSEDASKLTKDEVKSKIAAYAGYANEISNIIGAVGSFVAEQKEAELQAVGDNEAKKKQIAKKYADTEMGIKIAQIIASTAAAIMQSFAQLGPIAGAVASVGMGTTGGVQVAAAVRERNRIKGFRSGYYPVLAEDGRTYNSSFGGYAQTGIVSKPTVFLAGEDGSSFPEMIIDGPTFRNIQMNAPEVLDIIYKNRANSTVPNQSNPNNSGGNNGYNEMTAALNRLGRILDRGVYAKVFKREIDDLVNEDEELDSAFN